MTFPLKSWLMAIRPHTLPLAMAGILIGNLAAFYDGPFSNMVFLFSLATAVFLQILSNLANDYGDFMHGTDNENRTGPQRVMQSGLISKKQMKTGLLVFILLSLLSGLILLCVAFPNTGYLSSVVMLILGLAGIWAAWNYTASKNPYGYRGWGDVFVFLFFGLLAVAGTYFLQTGTIEKYVFLPAVAMGAFSTAVLNINNLRDINNDTASGKKTLASILGIKRAKWYHAVLVSVGIIHFFLFAMSVYSRPYQYFFLLPLVLFMINIIGIFRAQESKAYTHYLKQLSLFVLIAVLSLGISIILYRIIV